MYVPLRLQMSKRCAVFVGEGDNTGRGIVALAGSERQTHLLNSASCCAASAFSAVCVASAAGSTCKDGEGGQRRSGGVGGGGLDQMSLGKVRGGNYFGIFCSVFLLPKVVRLALPPGMRESFPLPLNAQMRLERTSQTTRKSTI